MASLVGSRLFEFTTLLTVGIVSWLGRIYVATKLRAVLDPTKETARPSRSWSPFGFCRVCAMRPATLDPLPHMRRMLANAMA
jgi:hypothetical protein